MKKNLNVREIQLEELKILCDVRDVIEKNNLRYSLCGGTLLGAIRHKGFIPWDDDIDIAMPRPDYEKLIKIFEKENKNKDLELQCYENGNLFQPFAKVVNKNIEILDHSVCDQERRFLWIDIFPLEGLTSNDKELVKSYKKARRIGKLIYISHYSVLRDNYSSFFKKILKLIVKPYALLFSSKDIVKIATKYDYDKSDYVGSMVWAYGPQERNKKEDLDNYIECEFEGKKFKCFKGYDTYLTQIYHDYMKLPPIEKRVMHGIVAWKIKEK